MLHISTSLKKALDRGLILLIEYISYMITERELLKLKPKLKAFAIAYAGSRKRYLMIKKKLSEPPSMGITTIDDIVQNVLIILIRKIRKADEIIESYEAWSIGACKKVIKNTYKRAYEKKQDYLLRDKFEKVEDKDGNQVDPQNLIEEGQFQDPLEDGFNKSVKNRCLKKLNNDFRITIILNIFYGYTTKAISEELGKSQNTVLTWLTKAKREFRDCILGK